MANKITLRKEKNLTEEEFRETLINYLETNSKEIKKGLILRINYLSATLINIFKEEDK